MPPDLWPSLGRAVLLSFLALLLNRALLPVLANIRLAPGRRILLWAAIMAPFFTPPLLTAYAYTKPFLHLSRHPWLEELAYECLLFCRVYPLGLLAGHLLPRRLTSEGEFCYGLVRRENRRPFHFRWRHGEPVTLVSALLVFLYAFHEFEMASLLLRPAWTVEIFDAQAQGYALGETWKRLWLVTLLQVGLLGAVFHLVWAGEDQMDWDPRPPARRSRWLFWFYLSAAALVMTVVPFILVGAEAQRGLARLPEAFSMHAEIGSSLKVAFVAATLAYLGARQLMRLRSGWWLGLFLLPGLSGTLLLSLSVLRLVQLPGVIAVRDEPVPLVLGLSLYLLPILTLLVALARGRESSEAGWSVTLTPFPPLVWSYFKAPHLGIWAAGFYLAYFEVTASAILAPASMASPVMVRLYNLMHYGRATMLSAYVVAAVAVPLAVLALATALGYGLRSRRGRNAR